MSKAQDFEQATGLVTRSKRHGPRLDRRTRLSSDDAATAELSTTSLRTAPAKKAPAKKAAGPATREAAQEAPARMPEVVIPRHVPDDLGSIEAPAGFRICPSPSADRPRGLLRQTISVDTCETRQCGSYHKCGGCIHATQPQWAGRELDALENGPTALAQYRPEAQNEQQAPRKA